MIKMQEGAQVQLQNSLPAGYIDNPEIASEIQRLETSFDKALQGDADRLVQAINTTHQLFLRQADEEEELLQRIAEDSQLELQLSIILPLLSFVIIFINWLCSKTKITSFNRWPLRISFCNAFKR
jgi:hypothetical protein